MRALAKHLLVELQDCNPAILKRADLVKDVLLGAARASRCTVVESSFHEFSLNGISGVVVIAESHFTVHTWPEFRYAAVDVFTCGEVIRPEDVVEYLKEHFQSKNLWVIEMKRGVLLPDGK